MCIHKESELEFYKRTFSPDCCFVCNCNLNSKNETQEHIYPKWLQDKYDLYNQKIKLLNQTLIQYRNLKVPCCKKCNEIMSKKIEKPMERAISKGYSDIMSLDRNIVFQWLNKLMYGLLYKETMIKRDRTSKSNESIFSQKNLQELHMKYLFLKTIIMDTNFTNSPFSLLIFQLKQYDFIPFWVHDSPVINCISLKLGNVGIIANLQDNSYNEEFFREQSNMNMLLEKNLHFLQFLEVYAKFLYKSSLFIKNPNYLLAMNNDKVSTILPQPIAGIAYNDWSQEEYANILSLFWKSSGYDCGSTYFDGEVTTLLWNKKGAFIEELTE